jgi:hypothetical protein
LNLRTLPNNLPAAVREKLVCWHTPLPFLNFSS